MTAFSADRVTTLLLEELAAATGLPPSSFVDDALLADLGVDSLALIEVLIGVRDQILEEIGLTADDVDEPEPIPWLDTVGELIAYVRSSIPATVSDD